mmetsp:Transcript_52607/g.138040  ORF Transcript_52607/g.138040 Transcript_52607/m.138040 type:complete len:145 (+) Transcript_52607:283-717(+)
MNLCPVPSAADLDLPSFMKNSTRDLFLRLSKRSNNPAVRVARTAGLLRESTPVMVTTTGRLQLEFGGKPECNKEYLAQVLSSSAGIQAETVEVSLIESLRRDARSEGRGAGERCFDLRVGWLGSGAHLRTQSKFYRKSPLVNFA